MEAITNINTAFAKSGAELVKIVQHGCMTIIPAILFCLIVVSIYQSIVFEGHRFNAKPLLNGIILYIALSVYGELTYMISSFCSALINTMDMSNFIENSEKVRALALKENGLTSTAIWWMDGANNFSWALLSGFIRGTVQFIRSFVLLILYVVGPIAITLSAIPNFKDSGLSWLKAFVSLQFWELTLRLLDTLYDTFGSYIQLEGSLVDTFTSVPMFYTAITILYFLTPVITNLYINGGIASSLFSTMVSTATSQVTSSYRRFSSVSGIMRRQKGIFQSK